MDRPSPPPAASGRPATPGTTRVEGAALLRSAAHGGAARAHLVVVSGPGAGARLPLAPEQTLGRGADADLRIADRRASRVHARIRLRGADVVVADLGSKNGVRVNGARIGRRPRVLRDGDRIAVGETVLALAVPDAGAGTAAPVAPALSSARGAARPPRRPRAWLAAAALLALAAALVAAAAT